jgi:hypothetical protein
MSILAVRRALDEGAATQPLTRSDSATVLASRTSDADASSAAVLDGSDAFESPRAVINMITSA